MNARTNAQRVLAEDYAAQIDGIDPISVHLYFSGAALRAGGVQFAFVMKGIFYLRVDADTRRAFEQRGCAPFSYRGVLGEIVVPAYYQAPGEILDDPEELSSWATAALRAAGTAT